jgi:hypothetical protein
MNANTAKLPAQAIRLSRWLRSAWAVGEDSRRSPGQRRKLRCPVSERDLDRLRAQVTQLCQRALIDQPALLEDPDSVADRLDLGQDVRGEEDRLPALLGRRHALPERHLHQRVQPAGGLIQHQQVGTGG